MSMGASGLFDGVENTLFSEWKHGGRFKEVCRALEAKHPH